MKKNILTLLSVFCVSAASAQTLVDVSIDGNGKIVLSPQKTKYALPVTLVFSEADFKNKTITFYADPAKPKIVDAVFGSGDLGAKTDDDGNKFFAVQLEPDFTLDLKNDKTKLDGKVFFKVDASGMSDAIAFDTKPVPDSGNISHVPGSAVADAIRLNEIIVKPVRNNDDIAELNAILNFYGINSTTRKRNFFLDPVLPDDGSVQAAAAGKSLAGVLSSIGGLDVTAIADGFARFIVKRTKEELSLAFFDRLKEELQKYPDLQTVFPNTNSLLAAMGEQVYDYNNYINNLREAFRSDLQTLDENLPGIIDNHEAFFKQKGNYILATALRSACYVSVSLRDDMHPGDILETYPTEYFDGAVDADDKKDLKVLKGAVQTLQLISESFKANDSSAQYWTSIEKIRQVVNHKQTFRIFFGLVLQTSLNKYEKVDFGTFTFYDKLNTKTVADEFDKSYPEYRSYFLRFGSKVNELNDMISEYSRPENDSIRVEQYAKYFRFTAQFIAHGIEAAKLPYLKDIAQIKDLPAKTEDYFTVAYEACDLSVAINRRRYPEAVNHAVNIYKVVVRQPFIKQALTKISPDDLSKKEKQRLAEQLVAASVATPDQKLSDFTKSTALNTLKPEDVNTGNSGEVIAGMARYGAFMASLVSAKDSKQVADAVEAVAMPAGSSRVKRETRFNVAVNAYAGLFLGREVIQEKDKTWGKLNAFGLTVPVGISISKGHRFLPLPLSEIRESNVAWSSSWFISLFDIGAVAAFRFNDDSTEQIPSIQLKDIISPGLFWSLGIPKTPISINVGAQIGPNLRKVKADVNDYSDNMYLRYSASICVDLPLLNLYSRSR